MKLKQTILLVIALAVVLSEDGQEVRLYCFSEQRAAKERAIVERLASHFEAALTQLSNGLSKSRTGLNRPGNPGG